MKIFNKRRAVDKAAHWCITLGGATVILVILTLFVFIFLEVFPLLKGASVNGESTCSLSGNTVLVGIDEYQEIAYAIYEDGNVDFISLSDGKTIKRHGIKGINSSTITAVCNDKGRIVMGMKDGRVLTAYIGFSVSFEDDERIITPEVSDEEIDFTNEGGKRIQHITSSSDEGVTATVFYTEEGRLILKSIDIEETLIGEEEKIESMTDITALLNMNMLTTVDKPIEQNSNLQITSLAIDYFTENLYIGTAHGEVIHVNVRDRENPLLQERVKVSDEPVTSLGFLLGDVSIVVGDQKGDISTWMRVRDETSQSGWSLNKVHTTKPHQTDITFIASSSRNKCYVTAASDGTIQLKHATSGQTLLKLESRTTPTAIAFSPKSDGIILADSSGILKHWSISNPHPETTLKTLFGKVWYEGYEKPEYVWQSTGGSDDFEPKFSLIPLIFGTIKGTIYALIIAIPIGILSALYTSQFLHRSLKKIIKPSIEFMAALPSVILGFLAGLWLAPLMEKVFPAIIIMPIFLLIFITGAFCIWKFLPERVKGKYNQGTEALFLIPFFIVAILLSIYLGGLFESSLLNGDYRQWFLDILGLQYDQRNAVVVGFAMGFAILPIIFTISEDAMSNVPKHLTSASLALGAVPWQTAVRIVLPIASPAIFSAVMLGFGRAVGETMVVLMATGNTPIMDWNLFNGFRALAANIAVEIPEAPFGGTLYRVLFLAALLLFMTTFIVNTIAELIRQRMKKKYSHL
ncbi:MAG: ABC transporter permease subunit [Candidatus Scalindua sp.]|nr:ABC transporter permease subunit [Candidatus Scalindua sp.]